MPKKLVRRGRVKGYRPTRQQLLELFELAQKGIGADSSIASLRYSQGDLEISPRDKPQLVLPEHLAEVISEAGDPDELNNLEFAISQDIPVRRVVELTIGPGEWTTYRVESDDQTWAFGRYHELTDKLLRDRSIYAKGESSSPEVLQAGTDDRWRAAAWEPVTDWRISLAGLALPVSTILPIIVAVLAGFNILEYKLGGGGTKIDRADYQDALSVIRRTEANRIVIIGLTLSYLIGMLAWRRWLRSLLKSAVILRKASLISQFSFQNRKSDSVALASFYVSFLMLVITALATLIR